MVVTNEVMLSTGYFFGLFLGPVIAGTIAERYVFLFLAVPSNQIC